MAEEIKNYKCPDCGADLSDWREFVTKNPQFAIEGEKERPFECSGRTCGKRWKTEEILQNQEAENE